MDEIPKLHRSYWFGTGLFLAPTPARYFINKKGLFLYEAAKPYWSFWKIHQCWKGIVWKRTTMPGSFHTLTICCNRWVHFLPRLLRIFRELYFFPSSWDIQVALCFTGLKSMNNKFSLSWVIGEGQWSVSQGPSLQGGGESPASVGSCHPYPHTGWYASGLAYP